MYDIFYRWLSEDGYDLAYAIEDNPSFTSKTPVSSKNDSIKIYLNPILNNPCYARDSVPVAEDSEHRGKAENSFKI